MSKDNMNEIKQSLIYLACPYSHDNPEVRRFRHQTVNQVALKLHREGHFVYSPLTHNLPLIAKQYNLPVKILDLGILQSIY